MLEEKIIRSFSIRLNEKNKEKHLDFLWLAQFAEEFLETTLGTGYDFPIHPQEIIRKLSISVGESTFPTQEILFSQEKCGFGTLSIRKNRFSQNDNSCILLNRDIKQDRKNSASFFLLVTLLLHYKEYEEKKHSTSYSYYGGLGYVSFDKKVKKEDILIQSLSYFLAMPYHLTKKEISDIDDEESSIHTFCEYFSNIAEIPYEDTVLALKQIQDLDALLFS